MSGKLNVRKSLRSGANLKHNLLSPHLKDGKIKIKKERTNWLFPHITNFRKFFSTQKGGNYLSKYTPKKEVIRRRTVKRMKELGVYKVQYSQLIEVFVDMMHQYNFLTNLFEESGYQVMIDTEKSDGKKSPILASLESLRRDIGVYSDKLMLNPKSHKDSEKGNIKNKDDPFDKLFDSLGSG